ncbi:MAG: cation diffusion facilitator family transporter [Sphingomonadaceae bacterium]|jgi:cobalt-zinc-cadmium efflux system protein|nr:cation diffusion facilitator family transporter [Sphingomonadaceae bacterium]
MGGIHRHGGHGHGHAHSQGHGHNPGQSRAHGHDPDHDHDHGNGHHAYGFHHHHDRTPPPPGQGRAFAIAIALNAAFVVAEVVAGLWSGSLALLADAGHNLSDVLALLLAWGASVLAARPASAAYTWGFKSSSILAALANAALLWVALGAILLETVHRFFNPAPVQGSVMMAVAAIGIAINTISAAMFARGRKHDLNLRAAFIHLMADAAVSAGVVVAGAAILLTGIVWIDPLTSLAITLVIGWGSWRLLKDALRMGLLAVPPGIDSVAVREWLAARPGVTRIHDLHIWPMSTTETALTAHLEMPAGHPGDAFLHQLAEDLASRFGIDHATVQVEAGTAPCPLAQAGHH